MSKSHDVTIFHNPGCSASRNTLAMIRHVGIEPIIVEYLQTPPDADDFALIGLRRLSHSSRAS